MKLSNGIFIDTGAFLAMLLPDDQFSDSAKATWELLENEQVPLFSSEPVMIETANFLIRQQSAEIASDWIFHCIESNEIRWLQPSKEDLKTAKTLILKYSDQDISMTDAISFSLMKRYNILQAFTFDSHFSLAGFKLWC